jgi:hypothetical protein
VDAKALRLYVERHPGGVVIHMIDGTSYEIPHRDYIWFTPAFGDADSKVQRPGTSFWIADAASEEYRLVNALLVRDVVPLAARGRRKGRGKGRSAG